MTSPAQRLAELRAAGWTFTYSPHSLFIAAEHPLGGKQSICELRTVTRNGFDVDSFGEFIADYLNNAAAIAARERELEEEIATANREIDHRDGELAAACDMLNSWCRESGVEECSSPYEGLGLQKTIDRLWGCVNEKHYKQLATKDAEIAKLRSAAKSFLFWFDADGTPVDGFRFQEERVKLEEALKPSEATDNETAR